MPIAEQLARFARDIETAPSSTRHAAIRAVFDLTGAAIAGVQTRGGFASLDAARSSWGAGPAGVWFSRDHLTVPGAAFVNATYASMLDLDDGHRGAAGHPGAAIIPAVIATAQAISASAQRTLTAIVIGYEVGLRVAAARDFSQLRTTDTGRWCGYGVAASTGWLRRLSVEKIAHAMAIAGHTASGQFATGWTRLGHSVKEGIPWATANGLIAVDLAAAGHSGPVDLLDDPARYDQPRLLDALGSVWQIERSYLKPYSCCRWAHAAIDAVLNLQSVHDLSHEAIESIEVATFARACGLNNEVTPKTSEGAQYSVPFCMALALVRGRQTLLPLKDDFLKDPEVVALAERIKLTVDPDLDRMFPAAAPARVVIRANGATHEHAVFAPKGEPSNPLSQAELEDKFDALAANVIPNCASQQLKAAILELNNVNDLGVLMSAFGAKP